MRAKARPACIPANITANCRIRPAPHWPVPGLAPLPHRPPFKNPGAAMIFDYETLKVIWWCFVGVLLIGFALTDGFDFGVGTLLPFLGKSDLERRVIINSIGPTWEGNQTWLITAGGALFAAWPLLYAAAFSGFYMALMLVLFSLFFR